MLQLKKMIGKKVDILGVKVDKVSFSEAVKRVAEMVEKEGKHYVATPNPEFVVLAQKDKQFREILNRADLAVADGVGLLAATKFLATGSRFKNRALRIVYLFLFGFKVGWWILTDQKRLDVLPQRISGVDLTWYLAKLCAEKGYTMGFLGGEEGVADKAAECLKEKFSGLGIAGTWGGREADEILAGAILDVPVDILLVAFGHPKQEKWIAKNLKNLKVKVAIGIGGSLDFLVGKPKRAPLIIRRLGLEWVWRLVQEPQRWRRILTAFPYFPWLVFWSKVRWNLQGEDSVVK